MSPLSKAQAKNFSASRVAAASSGRLGITMKLALANGHDSAPGMSVRITPKPGVASQLALAAAAISDAGVGATARPSLFTIRTKTSLLCLAYAYSA